MNYILKLLEINKYRLVYLRIVWNNNTIIFKLLYQLAYYINYIHMYIFKYAFSSGFVYKYNLSIINIII